MTSQPLIEVHNLHKHFPIRRGIIRRTVGYVKAVDDVSFDTHAGETLGLVGESGFGKSTTARAILMLQRPTAGTVRMEGRDLTTLSRG